LLEREFAGHIQESIVKGKADLENSIEQKSQLPMSLPCLVRTNSVVVVGLELERHRQRELERQQQRRQQEALLPSDLDMDLGTDPHFSVDELSQLLGDDVFS
jgi:hypothetical protein